MPELEHDPEFAGMNMTAGNPKLGKILEQAFAATPRHEWLDIFRKARLPHGAVSRIADLESDPQVLGNNYIFEHDHPVLGKRKLLGFPWGSSAGHRRR